MIPVLLVRVGSRRFAIPLAHVVETMRPLAVEAAAGAVRGVLGMAVVRGRAAAAVDLGALLGEPDGPRSRWVTVRAGPRVVALAVGSVDGLAHLDAAAFGALPPLVGEALGDAVLAVGRVDRDLCLLLEATRLLPAEASP